jgi:hypothetical protein
MTDFERIELAFDILENCRVHDQDGSLVLLEVDRKLWEEFKGEEDDEEDDNEIHSGEDSQDREDC